MKNGKSLSIHVWLTVCNYFPLPGLLLAIFGHARTNSKRASVRTVQDLNFQGPLIHKWARPLTGTLHEALSLVHLSVCNAASSPARAKNGNVLFAHAFNLPQDVGTPCYFLILPYYVTSEFGFDIVYLSGYYNGV